MSDFNQYQVDHEVSDQIVELLRKCAGNDPRDRITALDRMTEILRYEADQERKRLIAQDDERWKDDPSRCQICTGPAPCDCIEMLEALTPG